ncbi:hypothetical protein [Streptomyces sp. NPDC088726]|uniref:hypothetical protein n=1 Tax=Streptomyces sp. NPDC088726 TaxID=3365874 RepID=UPI003804517E
MTGSEYDSSLFFPFVPKEEFLVGSYKSSGFGVVSKGSVAGSAAARVHPLAEIIDNRVGDAVHTGGFPWGGTGSKIFAHRAGAPGDIGTARPLSTDVLLHGRQMDKETRVRTAPDEGVRFGGYTGPMTQATLGCSALVVPAALVGAVGR